MPIFVTLVGVKRYKFYVIPKSFHKQAEKLQGEDKQVKVLIGNEI
jgi:hypothetical protein